MLLAHHVGRLVEPFTGRVWDCSEINERYQARVLYLADRGLQHHDRVFVHYGNSIELFIDLLASWYLGACVVLVDSRLTHSEVMNLAQVALPKLSVWNDSPSDVTKRALATLGVGLVQTTDREVVPNARATFLAVQPVCAG